jgi:hypothetical protein
MIRLIRIRSFVDAMTLRDLRSGFGMDSHRGGGASYIAQLCWCKVIEVDFVALQQRLPSAAGVLQAQALMSPATDIGPFRQPHCSAACCIKPPVRGSASARLWAIDQFCADDIRQIQAEDNGRIQGTEL